MISKKQPDIDNNIQTQNNFYEKRKRKILQNKMKIKKEKKTLHYTNVSGLSKRSVDLRNSVTRLTKTLFKVLHAC